MNKKRKFKEQISKNLLKQKQMDNEKKERLKKELKVLEKTILEATIFTLAVEGIEKVPSPILKEYRKECETLNTLIQDGYLEQIIDALDLDRNIIQMIKLHQSLDKDSTSQ